jgi:hypothetical protein
VDLAVHPVLDNYGCAAWYFEPSGPLFEVTPTDPATLVAVSGVLLLVAVIAGLGPTRRAMRIDPMTALRSE